MRDVRRRDHLAPGLLVKIVRPEDAATGVTREGEIQEVVSKEPYDPEGIVVRLATGEVGRVLRVWEGGRARELPVPEGGEGRRDVLPTYDPPRPPSRGRQFRLRDDEVERLASKELGELADPREIERMIQHHEDGLAAPLLRRYGIRSEDLEKKTADLLMGVDDDALARKLAAGPMEDRDDGEREADGRGLDERSDVRRGRDRDDERDGYGRRPSRPSGPPPRRPPGGSPPRGPSRGRR